MTQDLSQCVHKYSNYFALNMSITRRQKEFLQQLIQTYGNRPLPPIRTLADDLRQHRTTVYRWIQVLEESGYLAKDRPESTRFYIHPKLMGVPLLETRIPAGEPVGVEEDYLDQRMSLDEYLIQDRNQTFLLKVKGDSMINAGIYEGDIVVVSITNQARDGQIIVARIDGEMTLKYLRNRNGKTWLDPANEKYPPIHPRSGLEVRGVMTGLIRKL